MLKNILAVVGAFFVAKKGYEHYQEYSELKREKEELQERLNQQRDQAVDRQSLQ